MNTLKDYVEWGLTHCDKTASAEGVPLVMGDCVKNKRMKQLEVHGESVQIGGKNMLNPEICTPANYKSYTKDGDTLTVRGKDGETALGHSGGCLCFPYGDVANTGRYGFLVKKGASYTLSFDYLLIEQGIYDARIQVLIQTATPSYIRVNRTFTGVVGENVKCSVSFTSNHNERLSVYIKVNSNYVAISNIQFEEGSVATEYEPFIAPSPEAPVEVESVGEPVGIMLDKDLYGDLSLYSVSESYTAYKRMYIEGLKPDTPYYVTVNRLNGSQVNTVKTVMVISGGTFSVANGYYSTLSHTNGSADYNFSPHTTDSEGRLTIGVSKNTTQEQLETILSNVDVYFAETKEEADNSGKYKIPLTVTGKNLLDFKTARNRDNYTAGVLTFDDDSLTYVGNYYFVFDVALESGKTYVFSAEYQNESGRSPAWYLVYSDGTQYSAGFKKSITIPSEKTVVFIRIYTTTGTANANVDTLTMRNIQLEESSVVTDYEPYVEPITTNVYLSEPLCKYGKYVDVLDVKGKKVIRNIYENDFSDINTSSLYNFATFNPSSGLVAFRIAYRGAKSKYAMASENVKGNAYCNMYPIVYSSQRAEDTLSGGSTNCATFDFIDSNYTTQEAWIAHINELTANGTPLKVIHTLKTPYEEAITCELPTLNAKTTVIDIGTSILPSNLKGKYIKK